MTTGALLVTDPAGVRLMSRDRRLPRIASTRGPSMSTYVLDATSAGHRYRVEIDLLRDCVIVLPVRSQPGGG